jgi:hypothetical protein
MECLKEVRPMVNHNNNHKDHLMDNKHRVRILTWRHPRAGRHQDTTMPTPTIATHLSNHPPTCPLICNRPSLKPLRLSDLSIRTAMAP